MVKSKDFDHGIVCLSFLFFWPWYCLSVFSFLLTMVLFVCLFFSFDHGITIPLSKEK
jgi:MFS superfamily sulfate permease-like transporter